MADCHVRAADFHIEQLREPEKMSNMPAKIIEKPKSSQMKKLEKVVEYLNGIRDEKFTGYIKINYTQGNVGRVEKFEEILRK
ncbi:MAG: hypothetical protein HKP58_04805 [Desulfatitalea sp.]|nr:hypothetical protein [Desulfatitalea sp.]NNJ99712.1 hypothetical protein [Desulfatitalea sp.]